MSELNTVQIIAERGNITDRIDETARIPPEYRVLKPPAPKSVKIELTGQCNYRCGFCALAVRQVQPTKPMDREFFFRIAREMREAGVEQLGPFFIGESFMVPDFLAEAISFARKLEYKNIFLTTNGSLATPDRVRTCIEAGLHSLKWSVNNADDAQFTQVTRVKPLLFHHSIANIKEAKSIRDEIFARTGHFCELSMSSILYDGEQGEKMKALRVELAPYVDTAYWLPLYTMGSFALEREAELGFKPTAGNMGRVGALVAPLPCWSVFTEGHIMSDGRLSACCFDADGHWVMADLNKVSFMEGWHSQPFQELRQAHLSQEVSGTACEKCALYV